MTRKISLQGGGLQRELTETSIEFKFVSISKNKGQTCKLHLQFHVFFIELTPELHQKHVINIFYDFFLQIPELLQEQ